MCSGVKSTAGSVSELRGKLGLDPTRGIGGARSSSSSSRVLKASGSPPCIATTSGAGMDDITASPSPAALPAPTPAALPVDPSLSRPKRYSGVRRSASRKKFNPKDLNVIERIPVLRIPVVMNDDRSTKDTAAKTVKIAAGVDAGNARPADSETRRVSRSAMESADKVKAWKEELMQVLYY